MGSMLHIDIDIALWLLDYTNWKHCAAEGCWCNCSFLEKLSKKHLLNYCPLAHIKQFLRVTSQYVTANQLMHEELLYQESFSIVLNTFIQSQNIIIHEYINLLPCCLIKCFSQMLILNRTNSKLLFSCSKLSAEINNLDLTNSVLQNLEALFICFSILRRSQTDV